MWSPMGGNGYPPNLCNKLENNPNNQDLKIVSAWFFSGFAAVPNHLKKMPPSANFRGEVWLVWKTTNSLTPTRFSKRSHKAKIYVNRKEVILQLDRNVSLFLFTFYCHIIWESFFTVTCHLNRRLNLTIILPKKVTFSLQRDIFGLLARTGREIKAFLNW